MIPLYEKKIIKVVTGFYKTSSTYFMQIYIFFFLKNFRSAKLNRFLSSRDGQYV